MAADELAQVIEQYHRSLDAVVRGDAAPQKRLFSRSDDATLANPFGPPARGWAQVEQALDRAVAQLRDGEPVAFERVSGGTTTEMAYLLEIERTRVKVGGTDALTPVALRVTTVFRREGEGWRIVHRHADPITAPRPPASIVHR
jgi:ketosteroid isomerase-like protein